MSQAVSKSQTRREQRLVFHWRIDRIRHRETGGLKAPRSDLVSPP